MRQISKREKVELLKWCQSLQIKYFPKVFIQLDYGINYITVNVVDSSYTNSYANIYFNSINQECDEIYRYGFKQKIKSLIKVALERKKTNNE